MKNACHIAGYLLLGIATVCAQETPGPAAGGDTPADRLVGPAGGRTPDEVRAWKLFGIYTRSQSIQRKAEANLEQWQAVIEAAKSGADMSQVNPDDAATVTKLLRLIRDEGEHRQKIEAAWDKDFAGYYGSLKSRAGKTYSITRPDAQQGGKPVTLVIDQMEYRLRAFPFGERDKRPVTEPDTETPLPAAPVIPGEKPVVVQAPPTSPPPLVTGPAQTPFPPPPTEPAPAESTVAKTPPPAQAPLPTTPPVTAPPQLHEAAPAATRAPATVPTLPAAAPAVASAGESALKLPVPPVIAVPVVPVVIPVITKPSPPPPAPVAPPPAPVPAVATPPAEPPSSSPGLAVPTTPTAGAVRKWSQMSQQERFDALKSNNMEAWQVFRQETEEALNP